MSWDNETTVETVVLLSKGMVDSRKVKVYTVAVSHSLI